MYLNIGDLISGFTIRNGYSSGGGGIYCEGGIIQNCTISNNVASNNGGGMICTRKGLVQNCIIIKNSSDYGGGIRLYNGTVQNCTISGNSGGWGGGVFCSSGGTVQYCTIKGNKAYDTGGGGIGCYNGGTIQNCIISRNSAYSNDGYDGGGGIYCDLTTVQSCIITENYSPLGAGIRNYYSTVQNCTIYGNSGNGVYIIYSGSVQNSIIWNNSGSEINGNNGYNILNMYNCIQNWSNLDNGNINDNPQFVSSTNFHLQNTSPCKNAGTNLPYVYTTTDLDGNPRIFDNRVDMGCYEITHVNISITNPANTEILVAADTINLSGTALAAQQIGWYTSAGSNGFAVGTDIWSADDVPIAESTNTITAWAVDGAGNTATTSIVVYNDKEKPDITNVSILPNPAKAGTVNLSLDFSKWMENPGGISVTYQPDNVTFSGSFVNKTQWTGTAIVSAGNDGTKTINVSGAEDEAGILMDSTNNIANFLVDTISPTTPILVSPINFSYWGSATVLLEWENGTDTNGIAGVEVEFNGSPVFPGVTNKLERSVTSGSINNWRVRNFDVAGNTSDWSESWQFTVDTGNPVVNLISPNDGLITNGVPELQWSISGISPVASNVLTLDSIEYFPGTLSKIKIAIADGVHSWQVKSVNILGRSGTSTTRNFTYDTIPPVIATNALIFPFSGVELFEGETTNIIWNAEKISDNVFGTNVIITKISVYQTNDILTEVAVVTNNIQNILGEIEWEIPADFGGSSSEDEIYMLRFDVMDSGTLTNSRYFYDNEFTVVPEACYLLFIIVLIPLFLKGVRGI